MKQLWRSLRKSFRRSAQPAPPLPVADLAALTEVRGGRLIVRGGNVVSTAAGNQQITAVHYEEFGLRKNPSGHWDFIIRRGSNAAEEETVEIERPDIQDLARAARYLRLMCLGHLQSHAMGDNVYIQDRGATGIAAVERALARQNAPAAIDVPGVEHAVRQPG